MVTDDILRDISSRYLDQNISDKNKSLCEKCSKMKDDIIVILNELKSTQEIIR
jgi:hypothetical protein